EAVRDGRRAADPRTRLTEGVRGPARSRHRAMTGLPLLPAAVAATALALVAPASPLAAPLLAIVVAIACAGLALASADRMRRLARAAAGGNAGGPRVRLAQPPQ